MKNIEKKLLHGLKRQNKLFCKHEMCKKKCLQRYINLKQKFKI